MDVNLLLIILGLVVIVLMMAFIINPPEAWIKRVFHRNRERNKP